MTSSDTLTTTIDPVRKLANEIGDVVTDQQIALRLARTLIKNGYTADLIPGSNQPAEILVLFAGLPPTERLEMGDLIARRAGHDTDNNGWPKWLENLLAEVENGDHIAAARTNLAAALDNLRDALTRVDKARDLLQEVFDVEIVETAAGELFDHHLKATRIAIRTTIAVNPVKED